MKKKAELFFDKVPREKMEEHWEKIRMLAEETERQKNREYILFDFIPRVCATGLILALTCFVVIALFKWML